MRTLWRAGRLLVPALLATLALLGALGASAATINSGDLAPGLQIPAQSRPGPDFDVERATAAYLALLSPGQRARSDAYFEGGYAMQLGGLVYGLALAALLLGSGLSVRMRDLAGRVSARPWLRTWIYAALFLLAYFALALPWSIYEGFVREHRYGLATQGFADWMLDALKGLAVSLVAVPPALVAVYAAVRRAGARWWLWAGAIACVFLVVTMVLFPVYVAPLFNDYKPLREGPVREAVLSLARANGIPSAQVVEFDASRQTTRISANVAGLGATARVALNDNLLDRTSLPEIKAVLGHEMGHYVLNHAVRLTVYFGLVLTLAFGLTHLALDAALARLGGRLRLQGRSDPAALPLAVAIVSVVLFLATPLMNSIVRQAEAEADAYGLNAAREPHGFAMVAMRLSTYRKIHPAAWEEAVFFDHPSGYTRVREAMVWLKENPGNPTANAPLPR